MSFWDLTSVKIEKNMTTVASGDNSFSFSSANILQIAIRIVNTRCSLFDPKLRPINLAVAVSLREQFQNQNYNYTTSSILADRFIVNCLHYPPPIIPSKVEEAYSFLSNIKTVFTISDEMLKLPYISAISAAVALDKKISDIQISAAKNLESFKILVEICKTNKFIKRVFFEGISIQGNFTGFAEMLSDGSNCAIDEWYFNKCNFEHEDFKYFLEAFKRYNVNIKTLVINNCTFTKESFSTFTGRFFFLDCFHKLSTLWLGDVDFNTEVLCFLQQLFASDWVLKDHYLKTLIIPRCCVELDGLFEQMQMFETGIITADFSGNLFINTRSYDLANRLSKKVNFVLADCGFAGQTLPSLLQALSKHNGTEMRLNLARVLASESCWEMNDITVPHIRFNTLTSLTWDGNIISEHNVDSFCAFVGSQPILRRLSICDCVTPTKPVIDRLAVLLRTKPLTHFLLANRPNSHVKPLGASIESLLLPLFAHKTIEALDISGQCVPSELFTQLVKGAPFGLRELIFDGCEISKPDDFTENLHAILLNRTLKSVRWPKKDAEAAILKISVTERADGQMNVDLLKKRFEDRFGVQHNIDDEDRPENTVQKYAAMFSDSCDDSSRESLPPPRWNHEGICVPKESSSRFRVSDPDVEKLRQECSTIEYRDPIVSMIAFLERETSLAALRATIGVEGPASDSPFVSIHSCSE